MDKRLLDNPTEMVCESSILYGREKRLTFEDIIVGNASHYSGPMDNIPTFITRKHGDDAIAYDYTNLDPDVWDYSLWGTEHVEKDSAQNFENQTKSSTDLLEANPADRNCPQGRHVR